MNVAAALDRDGASSSRSSAVRRSRGRSERYNSADAARPRRGGDQNESGALTFRARYFLVLILFVFFFLVIIIVGVARRQHAADSDDTPVNQPGGNAFDGELHRAAVRLFSAATKSPRHTGVRYGTNIVRWGIATLASYGKVAIVITIIAR